MDGQHEDGPLRIWLVEDDEHDRVVCRRALRMSEIGFEVQEFHKAEEAAAELRHKADQLDAILCDYRLPGINALAFFERIRSEGCDVPFVMLTGAGTEKIAAKALRAGVSDYVIKEPDNNYVKTLPETLFRVIQADRDRRGRIAAERKLAESEHRLQLALDALDGGIWDWNLKTSEFHFTDSWYRMLGYEPNEVPGNVQTWQDTLHPDDRDGVMERLEAHFTGRTATYRSNHRLRYKNGEWLTVLDCGNVVERDEQGNPVRMTGTVVNLTVRKRVEQDLLTHQIELEMQNEQLRETEHQLESSRNHLRDLYDFAPVGYLTLDEHDKIIEANLTATTLLGIDRSKLIGSRLTGMLDVETKDAWNRHCEALYADGGRQSCEIRIGRTSSRNPSLTRERESETAIADPSLARRASVVESTSRIFEVQSELVPANGTDSHQLRTVLVDVTQRKHAEEELRIRDRSFESSPTGILITDATQPEHPIIYCNSAFERITGYSAAEVLGRNCRILQGEDRDQPQLQELREAIRQGRDIQVVLRNYRKDGSMFWNELSVGPVRNASGRITHFIGIQNDVTRRVEAEEKLKLVNLELEQRVQERTEELSRSERRFRSVVETAGSVILLLNPDGKILEWNSAAEGVFGVKRDEILGENYLERFVPADSRDLVQADIQNVLGGQATIDFENDIVNSAGETRTFIWNVTRLLDAEDRPYAIAAIGQDITARKAIEQSLRESEHRLRLVADAMPAFIGYVDQQQRVQFANSMTESVFGLSPAETQGRTLGDLFGEVYESIRPNIEAALSGKHVVAEECVPVAGEMRDFEVTYLPERDEDGKVLGYYVLAIDVTERKAAEIKMTMHQEELVHLGRVQLAGEMASGIAHELNQPLLAISLQSEICEKTIGQMEHRDELNDIMKPLRQITEQALRAGKIVNFLRNFVKSASPHRSLHDINEIVAFVIEQMQRHTEHSSVEIECQLSPDLPLTPIDRIQIEQVLINLIRNAMDAIVGAATTPGHIMVRTILTDDKWIQVDVQDDGPGSTVDDLDSLFESFVTTKKNGMGLGLSIVRTIIERHGGKIWATANDDRGLTLRFSLPLRDYAKINSSF